MTHHHHHRERVVRGQVASDHLVQLFDDSPSLAETVAEFLFEGWFQGQTLLIVARPTAWALISNQAIRLGCPVGEAMAAGRLVVLDAATTLASFTQNRLPRSDQFDSRVGSMVRRLGAENPSGLRVYGEMVDILAAQGDFAAAEELERLWNDLATRSSFTLLCGYSSANFADERTAARLEAICNAHSQTLVKPSDLLSVWILSRQPSFGAT